MSWLWKRAQPEADQQPDMRGEDARREAAAGLEETRSRTPEVHRVTQSLRELRERNGFLELIENAIQGGQRS